MAKPEILSDEQIVAFLQAGASEEQCRRALYYLYKNPDLKAMAYSYILHHKGMEQDAQELFQVAIVEFEKAVREGRFKQESKVSTYIISIVRWTWHNMQRKKRGNVEMKPEQYDSEVDSVDISIIEEEKRNALWKAVGQLDKRCQELLRYWGLSYSPEELCKLFGFSNTNMAKRATYRCRERLRDYFEANPHLRDELND